MTTETLFCDIETYKQRLLIGFKRLSDGKVRAFEHTPTKSFDRDVVRRIMLQNRIVTFNGNGFDVPLIFYHGGGASPDDVKVAADRIIIGKVRPWDTEKLLGISVPRLDHIDMVETQPNGGFTSLKTLNGRLHGPRMQDLPYPPDMLLTDEQWEEVVDYCLNSDIPATERLFHALAEPIALREAMGAQYGLDLRSKSDAQVGEAVIKKRVEQVTKRRVEKIETPAGTPFPFKIPDWFKTELPALQEVRDRLEAATFYVGDDGKVIAPQWLKKHPIIIGKTPYTMGIGGLHSVERNRTVRSDYKYRIIDQDVAAYYPAIILNSGLYPRSMGPEFLQVFRQIRDERIVAKRAGDKTADKSLKVAIVGTFGKLGSRYSTLYAPHLMIAITIGGQLALLMLIERAERAGIEVISGNTDGIVFRCPRELSGEIVKDRVQDGLLKEIVEQWEAETGFELEATEYQSLCSQSVNQYIAIKPDGVAKRKGKLANPHRDTIREQLTHNPNMGVCSDAVVALITDGTPLEETIRACTDIRDFVTVVNVKGGGTWRSTYLGKVVRFIWSNDGEEILYKEPHPSTGNFKKVSLTDGCRPLMDLPDALPADLDYDRYVEAAREILMDIGYTRRPLEIKKPRVLKKDRLRWLALAIVA